MNNWHMVLLEPAKTVLSQISSFFVDLLLVVIILVIGWIVAKVIKATVTKGLRALKIDDLSTRIELEAILAKGGITYSFSELIGALAYWVILLITFVVAINAIGLTVAADLLNKVVLFIPNIITGMFILVLGMFMATLLRNVVSTAASNAGLSQAKLLSKLVEVIVIVFAIFMVLEQLKIGIRVSEITLGIILGTVGLSVALAFGLGCRDIAGRYTNELIEKIKNKK